MNQAPQVGERGPARLASEASTSRTAVVSAARDPAATAVLIGGSLLTAAAAVLLLLALQSAEPREPGLAQVRPAELDAAIGSLEPVAGRRAADDARACKTPLAAVTLATNGPAGDVVRVRSGTYLSPPIRLGAAPQRVAIPYPAPYAAGSGKLQIEGNASALSVALAPRWDLPKVEGAAEHLVTWAPKKAC